MVHDAGISRLITNPRIFERPEPVELCSTDGDFARFQGLRWQNPLR